MAKSLEDTTFYRYSRLLSLNEVGGDPRHFAYPGDVPSPHARESLALATGHAGDVDA